MNKKNILINTFLPKIKKFDKNIGITKRAFHHLKKDYENYQIPLLGSYEKNYQYDFSNKTIKKFLKYKNIILIGMGGSVLGTKSIYSFLKEKIKKKVFFFDNLDSNLYYEYKKIKNLSNSCFIVAGKSGRTIETIINLGTIFSKKKLKNK